MLLFLLGLATGTLFSGWLIFLAARREVETAYSLTLDQQRRAEFFYNQYVDLVKRLDEHQQRTEASE